MDPKHEQIIQEFSEEMRSLLGENLLSVILYGSAVSGEFVPGRSDLNFLLVLKQIEGGMFPRLAPVWGRFQKRGVGIPLFLTGEEIKRSLDSFPVEFLEIQRMHRLVWGEDAVAGLEIPERPLRLQCEREIKGKLIQLRRGYLELFHKPRELSRLFRESGKAFVVIMRSALWLMEKEKSPFRAEEVVAAMEPDLGLSLPFLRQVLAFQKTNPRLSPAEADRLFAGYLSELTKISEWIDRLESAIGTSP